MEGKWRKLESDRAQVEGNGGPEEMKRLPQSARLRRRWGLPDFEGFMCIQSKIKEIRGKFHTVLVY